MKHLVRFNESTSGKRKKVLSISNIDYIYRLLSGLGCHWVYRKDFKGQRHDCKVVMQKVLNKDGQSGVIILKFRNILDASTYAKKIKLIISNNIDIDDDIVKITIDSVEKTDSISKYKEDIEDSLIEFTDYGYKLEFIEGCMDSVGGITIYKPLFKTLFEIHISMDDEYDDDDDYDTAGNLNRLMEFELNIKKFANMELHKAMISAIRKIQRFGLKVIVSSVSNDFNQGFELIVVCDDDDYFDEI